MRFNRGPGLALTAALALAACAASKAPEPARPKPTPAALPNAERIGDDLVMTPVGRDARGCVQYQARSESRPTLQAVFYRTRAGDFSTIEEEAACL